MYIMIIIMLNHTFNITFWIIYAAGVVKCNVVLWITINFSNEILKTKYFLLQSVLPMSNKEIAHIQQWCCRPLEWLLFQSLSIHIQWNSSPDTLRDSWSLCISLFDFSMKYIYTEAFINIVSKSLKLKKIYQNIALISGWYFYYLFM